MTSEKKVNVFIEFKNSKENKLGIPLPAGKVRVYKQDPADKALEFIGEEQIDHTPKDEDLSLQIGNAFDIVGERKQTDFQIETGRHWMQETIEIKLRNHKTEDVTVRVKEPMYRWTNWKITEKNHRLHQSSTPGPSPSTSPSRPTGRPPSATPSSTPGNPGRPAGGRPNPGPSHPRKPGGHPPPGFRRLGRQDVPAVRARKIASRLQFRPLVLD